jgi:hypothetical protein
MFRLPRIALAAAVLATMAAGTPAAAQEPRVPAGAVALVGDERIGKPEFRHWLRVAVRGDDQARRAALRNSTMLFLLHRAWTRQEAAVRGIAVKRSRVRRALERQKREDFPDERTYRAFLRSAGMTEADLLERLEFDLLQRRLIPAAAANVPAVTSEEVDRYYARHRSRYAGLRPTAARRAIRAQLNATREQRAVTRFLERFRARYRARTTCATGYVIDACSNRR